MNFQHATFLTSAAKLSQLPADQGIEVAFAGYSNAGKSSALNLLCQQKKLAKTSKTPGRTRLINLFQLDQQQRLVDLPGYGYAKVPQEMKQRWQKTLGDYLRLRECLHGLVIVMDIRHPLKIYDEAMIEWANEASLPVHLLLNKADKYKFGAAKNSLLQVQKQLNPDADISVQLFSALKRQGITELVTRLNEWYH